MPTVIKQPQCYLFPEGVLMNNISLSFELICLMSWLLKNEKQGVNTLIKQAVRSGFTEKLESMSEQENTVMAEQLYTTVLDFLIFLEDTLIKQLEEVDTLSTEQNDLLPMLKKIDGSFDTRSLLLSIRQAKARLTQQKSSELNNTDLPKQEVQQVLFETMLGNWKPNDEDPVN